MSLVFGFSTVNDGNMSVNWGEESEIIANRQKWLEKQGIKYESCVLASLLGGTEINSVGEKDKGKLIEGDGLITDEKNLALFMVTGDCFPVIMYNDKVLALVHCGFKGIYEGIIEKVINIIGTDVKAIFGPGARKENYKFALEEIVQKDKPEWKEFLDTDSEGTTNIDLAGYLKRQMIRAGISEENIQDDGVDTINNLDYFSHYRAKRSGEKEGRFATVACLS